MVKRTPKPQADEPQGGGWGSTTPNTASEAHATGNISKNPEDRQPPLDEGWNETVQREQGLGPDTANGPNPDYVPPAEEPKPKKARKGKVKDAEKPADIPTASGKVGKDHNGGESNRLLSIVERIERLAEEKQTIADDIKEVVAEAKAEGYDVGTLRKVMQRRKRGKEACDEADAILDLYEQAVGWND